ncbi:hypothetical protein MMC30_002770 [Trapelia coarctata]|nr:hypothetical protein [Trapelia coarctata]
MALTTVPSTLSTMNLVYLLVFGILTTVLKLTTVASFITSWISITSSIVLNFSYSNVVNLLKVFLHALRSETVFVSYGSKRKVKCKLEHASSAGNSKEIKMSNPPLETTITHTRLLLVAALLIGTTSANIIFEHVPLSCNRNLPGLAPNMDLVTHHWVHSIQCLSDGQPMKIFCLALDHIRLTDNAELPMAICCVILLAQSTLAPVVRHTVGVALEIHTVDLVARADAEQWLPMHRGPTRDAEVPLTAQHAIQTDHMVAAAHRTVTVAILLITTDVKTDAPIPHPAQQYPIQEHRQVKNPYWVAPQL